MLQAIEKDCVKWNLLQEVTERFACRRGPRAADHQVKITWAEKYKLRSKKTTTPEDRPSRTSASWSLCAMPSLSSRKLRNGFSLQSVECVPREPFRAPWDNPTQPISTADLFIVCTSDVVSGTNEDKIHRLNAATEGVNEVSQQIGTVLYVQYETDEKAGHTLPGLMPYTL